MYDIPMINLILPSRKLAYTLNIFLFDYVVSTQNGWFLGSNCSFTKWH